MRSCTVPLLELPRRAVHIQREANVVVVPPPAVLSRHSCCCAETPILQCCSLCYFYRLPESCGRKKAFRGQIGLGATWSHDVGHLTNCPCCCHCLVLNTSAFMLAADPWLALDKLEHFLFCAFIVAAVYAASYRLGCNRTVTLPVAVLLSILAAGGKELGDYLQVGTLHE